MQSSPSRCTLLTDRYHWRSRMVAGIVGVRGRSAIAPDRLTLGGMLREHGYHTAVSGKWHLGWVWDIPQDMRELMGGPRKDIAVTAEHLTLWQEVFSKDIGGGPMDHGFDRYFGTDVPNWPPFCYIEDRRTVGILSEFLPASLFKNHQASLQGPALKDWSFEPILPAITGRVCEWIGESNDLREEYPELVAELTALMERICRQRPQHPGQTPEKRRERELEAALQTLIRTRERSVF